MGRGLMRDLGVAGGAEGSRPNASCRFHTALRLAPDACRCCPLLQSESIGSMLDVGRVMLDA